MVTTREVRKDDLHTICSHRYKMFEDAGFKAVQLDRMTSSFTAWLEPRLESGAYFGYLAEEDGVVIAGIGMILIDFLPHPLHPASSQRGYILNVFVEPAHRGRRIATDLMKLAEADLTARGVHYAVLHATTKGRSVYQKLGWASNPEMAKALIPD